MVMKIASNFESRISRWLMPVGYYSIGETPRVNRFHKIFDKLQPQLWNCKHKFGIRRLRTKCWSLCWFQPGLERYLLPSVPWSYSILPTVSPDWTQYPKQRRHWRWWRQRKQIWVNNVYTINELNLLFWFAHNFIPFTTNGGNSLMFNLIDYIINTNNKFYRELPFRSTLRVFSCSVSPTINSNISCVIHFNPTSPFYKQPSVLYVYSFQRCHNQGII